MAGHQERLEDRKGPISVEFAGTAVSSSCPDGPIEPVAGDISRTLIELNEELM
jgi:hypothetical protein